MKSGFRDNAKSSFGVTIGLIAGYVVLRITDAVLEAASKASKPKPETQTPKKKKKSKRAV